MSNKVVSCLGTSYFVFFYFHLFIIYAKPLSLYFPLHPVLLMLTSLMPSKLIVLSFLMKVIYPCHEVYHLFHFRTAFVSGPCLLFPFCFLHFEQNETKVHCCLSCSHKNPLCNCMGTVPGLVPVHCRVILSRIR